MVARGFCAGLVSVGLVFGTNVSIAGEGADIPAGGAVRFYVPDGSAQSAFVNLTDVIDPQGQVASFRLNAYRDGYLVESARITVLEPGGEIFRNFNRSFTTLEVADAEGKITATVSEVGFCVGGIKKNKTCTGFNPSPMAVVTEAVSEQAIASDASDNYDPAVSSSTAYFNGMSSTPTADDLRPGAGNWGNWTPNTQDNDEVQDEKDDTPTQIVTDPSDPSVPIITDETATSVDDTVSEDTEETQVGDNTVAEEETVESETAESESEDTALPVFGENTPITDYDYIVVQAGPSASGSYRPSTPWLDQFKLSKTWEYTNRGTKVLTQDQVTLNEHGMPVLPSDHSADAGYGMVGGPLWFGTMDEGSTDVAGKWLMQAGEDVVIDPTAYDAYEQKDGDHQITFDCKATDACRMIMKVTDSADDAAAPTLVQLTDANGHPLSDQQDLANGLVTRSQWRKALYGYTDVRMMDFSGATTGGATPIRFDHFPDMDDASWSNQGFFVPFRMNEKQTPSKPLADIAKGTGLKTVYAPLEARLRAAYEVGAVYHHNFPHLFMEYKGHVEPTVLGQWGIDLFARDDLTEEQKQSLFNDTELQHVDLFGKAMVANQAIIPKNQVKIEIGNEAWNFNWPFAIGYGYFERKALQTAEEMGWGEFPAGAKKHAVQQGYELTKTIAYLRKNYPQIEWRGVMAVHTENISKYRSPDRPAPETANKYYNTSLRSLMIGYEYFWEDYAKNAGEWSDLYAAEPAQPGDWFEAQGTTYYRLEAKRSDRKTYIAGIPGEEFIERTSDTANWPALRQEILAWFMEDREDLGQITDERGQKTSPSSLYHLRRHFRALAEHAEAYEMQVTSYEGGSHARLGTYYSSRSDLPDSVLAFWRNFQDSVEGGLVQVAVHDAAIKDAKWWGLADFAPFGGTTTSGFLIAARKNFADVTPRYCEYVRWMPKNAPLPLGVDANDVETPQERCGGLIDYFDQARANGYYVGQEIKDVSEYIK